MCILLCVPGVAPAHQYWRSIWKFNFVIVNFPTRTGQTAPWRKDFVDKHMTFSQKWQRALLITYLPSTWEISLLLFSATISTKFTHFDAHYSLQDNNFRAVIDEVHLQHDQLTTVFKWGFWIIFSNSILFVPVPHPQIIIIHTLSYPSIAVTLWPATDNN